MNFLFTFFVSLFGLLAFILLIFQGSDLIISSLIFLYSGEYKSVLEMGLDFSFGIFTVFKEENWIINSGLLGLDLIVNNFLTLQYSFYNRWVMMGISIIITIVIGLIGLLFRLEIRVNSSNPKTPEDVSLPYLFAFLLNMLILAPLIFGGYLGIIFKVVSSFFK